MLAAACDVSDESVPTATSSLDSAPTSSSPGYGDVLVRVNGWDAETLERFRRDETVASIPGPIDSLATLAQLEKIEALLPQEWRPAAVGTAADCAQRWVDQFEAGADGVIVIMRARPRSSRPSSTSTARSDRASGSPTARTVPADGSRGDRQVELLAAVGYSSRSGPL
ncbi:MAG: hypothetical protein U5R31_17630 [Acidimicrobiia bacterium]|nr:hypothetical protein [Acidimicrobiia bacterium]